MLRANGPKRAMIQGMIRINCGFQVLSKQKFFNFDLV
jgi:hypothetical protein